MYMFLLLPLLGCVRRDKARTQVQEELSLLIIKGIKNEQKIPKVKKRQAENCSTGRHNTHKHGVKQRIRIELQTPGG